MALVHHVMRDMRTRRGDELVTPIGRALEDLLGGERCSLRDLADRFTDIGLGYVMASWMADGQPLAIGADALRQVLGERRVADLATVAGLPADEFVERLAHLLPFAVHRMAHAERARERA